MELTEISHARQVLGEMKGQYNAQIISGYSHPYNQCQDAYFQPAGSPLIHYCIPLVISSVAMMMPWALWDDVGYFTEPGGPGGSEDYDYCMRAKAKGYGFAVTEPQCVLHTGVTSSSGKPIVGADLVRENNARLEKIHGVEGKVRYL
jgi:GT2 family glycosyltransferase